MKTIYVVTQGDYSDYRICGVFDSEPLAKKFIETFSSAQQWYSMRIEEWKLNPYKLEIGKGYKPFFVRMSKEGDTLEIRESDSVYRFVAGENGENWGFDFYHNLLNHCLTKDEKHAIKITNEIRGQLIAEDKWD
jgi:hypothetical protein